MSGYSDVRWVNGYVNAMREERPIEFAFNFEDGQWEKNLHKKRVARPKQPDNEFKVRWAFRNNLNHKTFKITKKFWLDIEWCYKVKYTEGGNEHIFTESYFRNLIEQSRFRRINVKVGNGKEHFDDNELFNM